MKKLDYLRLVIENKTYRKGNWWFCAFAVTREATDAWKEDPYDGRIVQEPWGVGFVKNNEIVKIEDAKPNQPLFTMFDPIEADETWGPNIKTKVTSTISAVLINHLMLVDYFGAKVPFFPNSLKIKAVEDYVIQNRAVDIPGQPRDPSKIYLDEYLNMSQAVEFVRTLPTLSTSSLTEKNMTRPTGMTAFKKKLLAEKYNNDLSDPVDLANFEKDLGIFSDEYRKGDPSEGILVSGKIRNNANRKMFQTSGAEGGMGTGMVPIVESLSEGVRYTPESFQALINGSRAGSYFRGLDTVKGGVSFKLAVRVLASFLVGEKDCGSTLGLQVTYDKTNIQQLVYRVEVGKEDKPIENLEQASNYLGKLLTLRTPGWCRSKSSVICQVCAGPRLSKFPEGLAIPASDMTGGILAASMAAMHKNTTEVTVLDLSTAMS